jgi:hypothetical protein
VTGSSLLRSGERRALPDRPALPIAHALRGWLALIARLVFVLATVAPAMYEADPAARCGTDPDAAVAVRLRMMLPACDRAVTGSAARQLGRPLPAANSAQRVIEVSGVKVPGPEDLRSNRVAARWP